MRLLLTLAVVSNPLGFVHEAQINRRLWSQLDMF
jgi:hypothetical protein